MQDKNRVLLVNLFISLKNLDMARTTPPFRTNSEVSRLFLKSVAPKNSFLQEWHQPTYPPGSSPGALIGATGLATTQLAASIPAAAN